MNGTLHIYVFREGLLARLGHDLRLTLQSFEATLGDGRVCASFVVPSVRVDGAWKGGRVDPTALTQRDKEGIVTAVTHEIFHDQPEVVLTGELAGQALRGQLTMNGRTVPVELPLTRKPGTLMVDTEIIPSKWGIKPYRALAGALKLQDRWRVHLHLPWALPLEALASGEERWGVEPTTA